MNIKRDISEKAIDRLAWLGTIMVLIAPYTMKVQFGATMLGFVLCFVGIFLFTPQVVKAKQWNLVILNIGSALGYFLQIIGLL